MNGVLVYDGDVAYVVGECYICKGAMSYNPHKVPSTTHFTGQREPLCASCIALVNEARVLAGREPFKINADAYKPIPAEDL